MPVPPFKVFIEPLLRFLNEHPDGVPKREADAYLATAFNLSPEEREERLPSGTQILYKNRINWAHDRLKRAGLSSSPRRGVWRITEQGREFLAANPDSLSEADIQNIASMRLKLSAQDVADEPGGQSDFPNDCTPNEDRSPEERILLALEEIRATVAQDLLEQLLGVSPEFFEDLVLRVLHAMGYGLQRGDIQRTGATGDGGIDGIISLDRLGLEKVYVQAKKWSTDRAVGRPEIQAFYGALMGRRANKGVFITTTRFSGEARDYARDMGCIVLIDGDTLARLMIEHGVGVTHETHRVPSVDSDFFEEP